MSKFGGSRAEEARRKATDQFDRIKQRDENALQEREKHTQAAHAKTQKLRALRLAKEAADKEAAELKAAEIAVAVRSVKRKAAKPKPVAAAADIKA